ncbi:MAG: hypothetical protein RLY20_1885 [Verrucomicrobiota bacterium]|jgi:hypothetical protein
MSSFTTPLLIEFLDGRNYRLLAGFDYLTDIAQLGCIHVPAGFLTDFASIPRGLWNLLPPTGKYGKAAVIHDYLYRCCPHLDRKVCDQVLLEAMEVLGVSWLTRKLIYRAVRVFGGFARKRITPDESAKDGV